MSDVNPNGIEFIINEFKNMYGMPVHTLSTSERCKIASQLSPIDWPVEIIYPLPRSTHSIFGYQHVYMDRAFKVNILEALIWTRLVESMGDARKMIKNHGVRVNSVKVSDPTKNLTSLDAISTLDAIVIECGRYNYGIIEMCD